MNQVETHPFHQQVQEQQFMADNRVQIEAWGPFAEGKNDLFHNELLRGIGRQHQKSVAQVVLRWLTQRGVVAIPKSVKPERMAEKLQYLRLRAERRRNANHCHARHQNQPFLRPPRPQHSEVD